MAAGKVVGYQRYSVLESFYPSRHLLPALAVGVHLAVVLWAVKGEIPNLLRWIKAQAGPLGLPCVQLGVRN